MNDFTKEELEDLHYLCHETEHNNGDDYLDLKDKIQAMIDNFCEHIPSIKSNPVLMRTEGMKAVEWEIRCDKCLRVYYDN